MSYLRTTCQKNDPRWPIANIPGLQLSGKARRTRGRHTFRQILVAHGAEDSQWRSSTGRQRDSCGWRSGFVGTSARQLSVQSKRDWFPFWPRFGDPGRQSRLLQTQEGSQTGDSPGRKAPSVLTPLFWPAQWVAHISALGINNLDVHSET